MKKINNATKSSTSQKRWFRRLVKQMFISLLKRQTLDLRGEFQKVVAMQQDIKDSIEIIAREIARLAK